MTWEVALPLAASAGGVGLLAVITHRSPPVLVTRELLVPVEFKADMVAALFRHIAAVREGPVCVRVIARQGRIRFFVVAPKQALASLEAASVGLMPEARLDDGSGDVSTGDGGSVMVGASIGWGGAWPLLDASSPELTAAGLLGVLASVGGGEQLELMLRLWPAGRVQRPVAVSERAQAQSNPMVMRLFWPAQPPREEVRLIRAKYSGLLLTTEVIVTSTAGTHAAAVSSVQRVIAVMRSIGGVRGVVRYRPVNGQARVRRVVERRRRPLPWELHTVLSPEELTAICGLPIEAPAIQGIAYGTAPRLMPPIDLPTKGRIWAASNFPATRGQPLAQPVLGGLQHAAIVAPTGAGKSTLLASLIRGDVLAGRGVLLIDLKGDLVTEVLRRVPMRRLSDVVVLEPASGGAQPGLQLFPAGGDPELTSDLVLGTLQALFEDSWGIRSSQYLGLGLRTLAAARDATLVDLPTLFTDASFRRRALAAVTDPWLHSEWQRFLSLSPAEQATHLSSPLTKIGELIGRGRLRLVLGQSRSKLDFREVLARKRIVLVSLPPGLLGMPVTRLLAALTLWQFFQAVEARAALPPEDRSPFFAYIDEVAVLQDLPLPLESILERARGHGVGLTISPQTLSQLPTQLRAAVLANVGTLVSFGQPNEDDAKAVARALPGVTAGQLQHLGQYEVAMRLSLAPGLMTPTMTGVTLPPEAAISDPAVIRQAAALRWGQTLEEVDSALRRRHGLPDRDANSPESSDGPGEFGVSRRRP